MKGIKARLEEEVEVVGPNFIHSYDSTIKIRDSQKEGIHFKSPNGTVIVSPETLHPHKDISGSRYLVLRNNQGEIVGRVVEHLLSALYSAKIFDAEVECSHVTVPSTGPGIKEVYNLLCENRTFSSQDKRDILKPMIIQKKFSLEQELKKGIISEVTIEPSEQFEVVIPSADHPDIVSLSPEPMHIEDIYSQIQFNLDARPLARIQSPIKTLIYNLAKKNNLLRGIREDSYVLAFEGENDNIIISRMQEKYMIDKNEYMAHTIFADFFGEVHTFFPGDIKGKFTLTNTNHFTRMDALRKYYKSESPQYETTSEIDPSFAFKAIHTSK